MDTTTQNDTNTRQTAALDLAPCSAPSAEEIAMTRSALGGAKVRAGCKMTINTDTMSSRVWPTIEVWVKEKRRYVTLSVGTVWRYETHEARNAVLAALQNPKDEPRAQNL